MCAFYYYYYLKKREKKKTHEKKSPPSPPPPTLSFSLSLTLPLCSIFFYDHFVFLLGEGESRPSRKMRFIRLPPPRLFFSFASFFVLFLPCVVLLECELLLPLPFLLSCFSLFIVVIVMVLFEGSQGTMMSGTE